MRWSRRIRTADEASEGSHEPGSGLDLADWKGHWPVDDTPAKDSDADVPMMLNPNSPPTIAPS